MTVIITYRSTTINFHFEFTNDHNKKKKKKRIDMTMRKSVVSWGLLQYSLENSGLLSIFDIHFSLFFGRLMKVNSYIYMEIQYNFNPYCVTSFLAP